MNLVAERPVPPFVDTEIAPLVAPAGTVALICVGERIEYEARVAWNFTARLTNETGPTCRVRHAPGGITDVRVAGPRAEWVTTYGGVSTVFSASIILCE